MHCLNWLTPLHHDGKLRCACNPCYLTAITEPPGRLPFQHRVPISAASCQLAPAFGHVGLCGLLRGLFHNGRGVSWAKRGRFALSIRLPSASRLPKRRYEPLYVVNAAVAQRRISGMLATPESFRLAQSPLGADLLPQALVSIGNTPSPEGLSLALAD